MGSETTGNDPTFCYLKSDRLIIPKCRVVFGFFTEKGCKGSGAVNFRIFLAGALCSIPFSAVQYGYYDREESFIKRAGQGRR
jgi:hypothetical protein